MKKYFWLLCILLLSIIIISSNVIDSSYMLLYRIEGAIITFLITLILWIVFMVMILKPNDKYKLVKVSVGDRYNNISLRILKKYNINFDEFRDISCRKFKEIHDAMSQENLDLLKLNITKDLYDYYVLELDKMNKINIKNIMKDFEFIDFKIFNINDEYNLQIDVYLRVRMIDYEIDINSNKIINGSDNQKSDLEFELTFIKKNNTGNIYDDFVLCKKNCVNKMILEEKDVK